MCCACTYIWLRHANKPTQSPVNARHATVTNSAQLTGCADKIAVNIPKCIGIELTGGLVVVHIDAFQLQITVSHVLALAIDAMLFGDDFPELREKKGKKGKIPCEYLLHALQPWRFNIFSKPTRGTSSANISIRFSRVLCGANFQK